MNIKNELFSMLFLIVSAIGIQAQSDLLILMDNFTSSEKITVNK